MPSSSVVPITRAQLDSLGGAHIEMAKVGQEDGTLIELIACSRPFLFFEADKLVSEG